MLLPAAVPACRQPVPRRTHTHWGDGCRTEALLGLQRLSAGGLAGAVSCRHTVSCWEAVGGNAGGLASPVVLHSPHGPHGGGGGRRCKYQFPLRPTNQTSGAQRQRRQLQAILLGVDGWHETGSSGRLATHAVTPCGGLVARMAASMARRCGGTEAGLGRPLVWQRYACCSIWRGHLGLTTQPTRPPLPSHSHRTQGPRTLPPSLLPFHVCVCATRLHPAVHTTFAHHLCAWVHQPHPASASSVRRCDVRSCLHTWLSPQAIRSIYRSPTSHVCS